MASGWGRLYPISIWQDPLKSIEFGNHPDRPRVVAARALMGILLDIFKDVLAQYIARHQCQQINTHCFVMSCLTVLYYRYELGLNKMHLNSFVIPVGFASCRSCVCFMLIDREEPGVSWAQLSSSIGRYKITALKARYISDLQPSELLIIISKLQAICQGSYSLYPSCTVGYCFSLPSCTERKNI